MTNSKESDSITEKSEVVKTESKSNRWNWKTTIAVTLSVVANASFRLSAKLRPIRQRLHQWSRRKKTALVIAIVLTAAGTFAYQYKAKAIANNMAYF